MIVLMCSQQRGLASRLRRAAVPVKCCLRMQGPPCTLSGQPCCWLDAQEPARLRCAMISPPHMPVPMSIVILIAQPMSLMMGTPAAHRPAPEAALDRAGFIVLSIHLIWLMPWRA